jgi:hypothetical protein
LGPWAGSREREVTVVIQCKVGAIISSLHLPMGALGTFEDERAPS